jgi:hypothetical protein
LVNPAISAKKLLSFFNSPLESIPGYALLQVPPQTFSGCLASTARLHFALAKEVNPEWT